ncbi:unnamed protein product [Amoebophrya sp. A25]|nr:unnamed protein product [Amoebophrya sp. A25]|eukprot:GSA25T00021023001.1
MKRTTEDDVQLHTTSVKTARASFLSPPALSPVDADTSGLARKMGTLDIAKNSHPVLSSAPMTSSCLLTPNHHQPPALLSTACPSAEPDIFSLDVDGTATAVPRPLAKITVLHGPATEVRLLDDERIAFASETLFPEPVMEELCIFAAPSAAPGASPSSDCAVG